MIETFYLKSPFALQQVLVTAAGYSLNKIQRGGEYGKFIREIWNRQEWTSNQFADFQFQQLQKILALSYYFVPYYNKKFREIGLLPERVKSLQDIALLPILEKKEILRDPVAFTDRRIKKGELLTLHTTGTTGTPLKIYANKIARRLNYAYFDLYLKSIGIDGKKRRATFGGRIIVDPDQNKTPFWRYSYFQRNLLFSSYHMTDENLPYYFEKLKDYQPEIIESYPSSLYFLSKYILDHNKNGEICPRAIVTSGETLFEEQRKAIEEAFQCKVRDQYGCVEMCIFAAQCESGHYHYRPDYSLIEIIKKDGKIAKPGEIGEILCTGFINQVMPLIRYAIGDLGIISEEKCSCGLNTPHFEKIVGRMDDIILTPDGRYVGRLSPVLKGFPVKEAQYIQKRMDLVVIKLVKDTNFNYGTAGVLIKEVQKRLGNSVGIELEFVDEIPRGPGGKLKTVISEVSNSFRFNGSKTADRSAEGLKGKTPLW